jgi:predicted MFS family arabinose efflux permease
MAVFVAFMATASLRGVPLQTLASKLPAPHERAQMMSLQSATQHLASSLGAIAAAQILSTGPGGRLIDMDVVVWTSSAVGWGLPLFLWQVERRRKRQGAAAAAPERPAAAPGPADEPV